jgi:hypothetical protein
VPILTGGEGGRMCHAEQMMKEIKTQIYPFISPHRCSKT